MRQRNACFSYRRRVQQAGRSTCTRSHKERNRDLSSETHHILSRRVEITAQYGREIKSDHSISTKAMWPFFSMSPRPKSYSGGEQVRKFALHHRRYRKTRADSEQAGRLPHRYPYVDAIYSWAKNNHLQFNESEQESDLTGIQEQKNTKYVQCPILSSTRVYIFRSMLSSQLLRDFSSTSHLFCIFQRADSGRRHPQFVPRPPPVVAMHWSLMQCTRQFKRNGYCYAGSSSDPVNRARASLASCSVTLRTTRK